MSRIGLSLYAALLVALVAGPAWSAEVGTVRLPLAEYQRLLRESKPPEIVNPPPSPASWVASDYALSVRGDAVRLITTLDSVAWSEHRQQLPLPELGAVYAATFLAGPGITGSGSVELGPDGTRQLRFRGAVRLRLESVPRHDQSGTEAWVEFGVPDAPANRLAGTLPDGYAKVTVAGGVVGMTPAAGGEVKFSAQLQRGVTARLGWGLAAREAPREVLVATSSLARLYLLGDDELTVAGRLDVEVLRGSLEQLVITAPAELKPGSARVADNTVTSFERDPQDPSRVLLVLGRPVTSGRARLFWTLTTPFRLAAGVATMPEIDLPGFGRGESVVAVTSTKPIVVIAAETELAGYERIDESDLPGDFRAVIDRPVLFAARRRAGVSPALALNLGVFADARALGGLIDTATIDSVVKGDGRRVDRTRLELQSRDSVLRLTLPAGAEVWSVMLDGEPVRPLTEDGQLLVPLGRGRASLAGRVLEYVTSAPTERLDDDARAVEYAIPNLPLPVTRLFWDLFLPEGFRYRVRGGTVVPAWSPPPAAPQGWSGAPQGWSGAPQAANSVYGRVVDPDGLPLPGVTVTAVRRGSGEGHQRETHQDGSFKFSDLPVGEFTLSFDLTGFAPASQTVKLTAGTAVPVTATMQVSGSAALTVRSSAPAARERYDAVGSTSEYFMRVDGVEDREGAAIADVAADELPTGRNYTTVVSQSASAVGVDSIEVELPTSGKQIRLEGRLFIDEVVRVELERKRDKQRR